MNRSKKIGLLLMSGLTILSLPVFAQQMQCPGGTNFVSIGDSIAQVVAQCGQPKQTQTIKNDLIRWQYSVLSFYGGHSIGFSVVFNHQVVQSMTGYDGKARSSLTCPKGTVSVGNTMNQVLTVCGKPNSAQRMEVPNPTGEPRQPVIKLIYQPQTYLPETIFLFKNGQLDSVTSN